ncbi:MAG: hypothetical protein QXQ18_01085 [Candidatus Aenigmatarchaeota archaeon]
MPKNLLYNNALKEKLEEIAEFHGLYGMLAEDIIAHLKRHRIRALYNKKSEFIRFSFPYENNYIFVRVYCWISLFHEQCDVAVSRYINRIETNEISNRLEELFKGIDHG